MQRDIETKEIRGLTAKNLASIFGGIVLILVTVMTTYFNIMRKLDGIDIIQSNVNVMQNRIENNSTDIKQIQQQTIPSLDIRVSRMEEQMKDKVFIKSAP